MKKQKDTAKFCSHCKTYSGESIGRVFGNTGKKQYQCSSCKRIWQYGK